MTYKDNTQTLEELLLPRGTDEDYADFIGKLTKVVKKHYAEYQFLRQDPAPDDYENANCLVFQLFPDDFPEDYEYLFKLAIDKSLSEGEITRRFIQHVKDGEVLALGDVEVEDIGTGVSSIYQAQDLKVLISFTPKSRIKLRDEKREELQALRQEQIDKQKKKQEIEAKALQNLKRASDTLEIMTEKEIDTHDLSESLNETTEAFYGGGNY